jgi:large subunit ribosomal protein L10
MDNPRAEKVAVVDEVRSRLDRADAVIVTEYRGLKVKDLAVLRRNLAPLGGEYRIYKNTLVRIAASDRGHDGFRDLLTGPTALTFVEGDAAAVAKMLRDFARTNPLLLIKGGLLGTSVLGPAATVALADLPSRELLLARLAGALAAPIQMMAGLLAAVPRKFAYGLAALKDKRAAEAPQASEEPQAQQAAEAPASHEAAVVPQEEAAAAAEPVEAAVAEPEVTAVAEPEVTAAAEPEVTAAAEPEEAPSAEPEEAAVAEPEEEPAAEPVDEAEAEPADEAEAEPADEAEAEPADEAEAEAQEEPAAEPDEPPVTEEP